MRLFTAGFAPRAVCASATRDARLSVAAVLFTFLLPLATACGDDDDNDTQGATDTAGSTDSGGTTGPSDTPDTSGTSGTTDTTTTDSGETTEATETTGTTDPGPDLAALLEKLVDDVGARPFVDAGAPSPVSEEPATNTGYTDHIFDPTGANARRCADGTPFRVSLLQGTSDNVMIFFEGGGATWPGPDGEEQGFSYALALGQDVSFRSRRAENPLKDWSVVYVPYCDFSIHSGNGTATVGGTDRHFEGLRNTAAAAAFLKSNFPNAKKVLVAGSSAGGFGTYMAWPMVKRLYVDTPVHILNDSGCGFWNPDDIAAWQRIKTAWNLVIPEVCERCEETVFTYIYETYMAADPQLRIGMFSSYRDQLISTKFLGMTGAAYEKKLKEVTGNIRAEWPGQYGRFLIKGNSHTSYEVPPLLPGGPLYEVEGTSMFEWIDALVNSDAPVPDLLE
jgi:hypothetical protein